MKSILSVSKKKIKVKISDESKKVPCIIFNDQADYSGKFKLLRNYNETNLS